MNINMTDPKRLTPDMPIYRRDKIDITIMMDFSVCNYRCFYCCAATADKKEEPLSKIAPFYLDFIDSFDATDKCVRINSYGEITLMEGFWYFLAEVTTRAKVTIATNLTFDVELLYRAAPAKSILFLLTTLHPETEESFEQFIIKYKDLTSHGYTVLVHYIVDDGRLLRAIEHCRYLSAEGISFFLSPMQGHVHGRVYPEDLASDTKRLLTETLEELHPQLLVRYPDLAFTGLSCSAGYDTFCIRGRAITPCMNSNELLGWIDGEFDIFSHPSPCRASHARSQCLPDMFLSDCRCYCMGRHDIESSTEALAPYLARYASLYEVSIQPALKSLHGQNIELVRRKLLSIPDKVVLALFGLPWYPYFQAVRERAEVETLVLPSGGKGGREIPILTPTEFLAQGRVASPLVLLSSIYEANEARSFMEVLPPEWKPVLVVYDFPAELTKWKG